MDIVFNVSGLQLLQLLIAVILPVLVGLVTKKVTSEATKALLLLGLAVITALLTELAAAATAGVAYDLGSGLLLAISTFVVGVAVHYGLWKPVGVTAKVQAIGTATEPQAQPFG